MLPKFADRFIINIFLFGSLITGCTTTTDTQDTQIIEPPEPAVIEQIAHLIEGREDESVVFHLSDYFVSESPIISVDFHSDVITIEPMKKDSFKVSQPSDLTGEHPIQSILINEDQQKLESQLNYVIEPKPDTLISDDTLVIMPLGNSLTNDSRSRVSLWNLLTEDGHKLDYVGDQHQTSSIPDPDHEGVGGITIQGIHDKAERLMNTHQPEYVLLMAGTNDIVWFFDETGAEIASRWNKLIQLIFDSSDPGTFIIAATIPPVTSKIVGKEGMPVRDRAILVQHFNSALRSHVSDRADNEEKIILADMEAGLNITQHLSGDGVHLNEEGYKQMGTIYYNAVKTALSKQ